MVTCVRGTDQDVFPYSTIHWSVPRTPHIPPGKVKGRIVPHLVLYLLFTWRLE
jgi:hypothetical protein